jgi:hypothetical protein
MIYRIPIWIVCVAGLSAGIGIALFFIVILKLYNNG